MNKIFLICAFVHSVLSACWGELPLVRTGTFTPIISLTTTSTNGTTFSIGYTTLINSTSSLSWGLALAGYDLYLTKSFSFKVTVTSYDTVGMQVQVQPQDLTYILSLRMNYIVSAINGSSNPPMEVLSASYKMLNLDEYNDTIGVAIRNETYTQNSTMTYSSTVQYRSFLYSFNLTNLDGQLNYLELQTTLSAGVYTHVFITKEYNFLNYAYVTVIAWDSNKNAFGTGTAAFFQNYELNPTNRTTQVKYYPALDCRNLFFMGLYMISHQMGGERILGVHPQTYNLIASSFDYNVYFVLAKLNIFYIGGLTCNVTAQQVYNLTGLTCESNCTALYQANVNNTCINCNQFCLTCDSTDQNLCLSCPVGSNRNGNACNCSGQYFANGTQTNCLLCSTYLLYCIQCATQSICTKCQASKFLVNNTCQCYNITSPTYYVTGVCLIYPGCIDAISVINANYCQTCNASAKFQQVSGNKTCVCMSGYNNSVDPLVCASICGDGIISDKACDDNNNINGDGCSENCTIQTGWFCYGTNSVGPSKCILSNSTVSISYLYAQRILGTNTAKLYFLFSPSGVNLSSNALQGGVKTTAPTSSISTTYSSTNSRFTLLIEFKSDMEASTYSFTFNFTNAQTFYVDPITVTAQTSGINEPLIFQTYTSFSNAFSYLFLFLAFLGLVIGLVSSVLGYKLMGLELLLSIQTSFFALFCMSNPPPYISSLKKLKYSNGFNTIYDYNYEQFYQSNSKFPKFDYEVQMALNLNVMTMLLLLATLILLILQLIYLCYHAQASSEQLSRAPVVQQPKKQGKAKKEEYIETQVKEEGEIGLKMKSARQNRNKFVNNFYFFLAIALSEGAIFAFIAQNMQVSVTEMKISEDLNLTMGYVTLILVVGNVVFFFSQLSERKQKRIIVFSQTRILKYPVFLVFSYLLLTLAIGLLHTYKFSSYLGALLGFLPLIGLLYYRPYRHTQSIICTLSALLDSLYILTCSFVYVVNEASNLSEFSRVVSTVVILGLLIVSEALSIVRMIIVVPWRELPLLSRCLKKKDAKDEGVLLDKNKPDIELSSLVKNSIKGEGQKIVNWEQKNKKDYESIKSKAKEDAQNSEQAQNEEDQLAQLKRRLKKEIQIKRAV